MWIRTQGRWELVKTADIWFGIENSKFVARGVLYYGENPADLGEYNSEAEALAVLDDIQRAITNKRDVFVMPPADREEK